MNALRKPRPRMPLESDEAKFLFQWVTLHEKRFPPLSLLFHVPNEAVEWQRRAIMAGRGVRNGVPDYCLPVPRGTSHGLFLELKRQRGGKLSAEQRDWAERLTNAGYAVRVCAGWQEAAQALADYLNLPLRVLDAAREPTGAAKERPFSSRTQRPDKVLPRIGE